MKRTILFAFLVLAAAISAAQEHLTFKGIPIEGSITQFAQKLTQKGLTVVSSEDGYVVLNGLFSTFRDCTIVVAGDNNQKVARVAAILPVRNSWKTLESDYLALKSLLTQKYGEPVSQEERFGRGYISSEADKLYAVQTDQCRYECTFETDLGKIELSINSVDLSCCVMLLYLDKAGQQSVIDQALEDL